MTTPRKHLFGLLILLGFITYFSPGFIRQGAVYCDSKTPSIESVCAHTKLSSANGEFYLRYLSVCATMILVAILAGLLSSGHPKMKLKIYTIAILFALTSSAILIFNPPLVMMTTGNSAKYIQHAKSFQLGIISLVAPLIGLLGGHLSFRWVVYEHGSHQ